jgi:hypothetical protein
MHCFEKLPKISFYVGMTIVHTYFPYESSTKPIIRSSPHQTFTPLYDMFNLKMSKDWVVIFELNSNWFSFITF